MTKIKINLLEIPHFHFERVDSTNDVARELLSENSIFFVTADEQYAGKGRKGKVWVGNSYQNVYLSLAIDESIIDIIRNKMLYQIIGCLSVKAAIKELIDNREIKLKYPNDIYVIDNNGKYKKISGVLSEHSYSGNRCTETILGIGVNVNQIKFDELDEKATSLKLLGYEFEKDEIIEKLKVKLDAYLNSSERNVFNEWKNELNIIGKQVRIVNNNKIYKVISIDNNGTLNAKNDTEEININNGDSVIYDL